MIIHQAQAEKYIKHLIGKEAVISSGYGGVIFIEIGDLQEQKRKDQKGKLYYGVYTLFCDENWKFSSGKEKNIERWKSSSAECNTLFKKMGKKKISSIDIINDFEQTAIIFEGGYTFTIIRDDAIDTFQLTMLVEKKKLFVNGNGAHEITDYSEDRWWRKEPRIPKKKSASISVSRDFLREHVPDLLPITREKTNELIHDVIGETIVRVDISSATQCTLRLGTDYREKLSIEQRKHWNTLLPQWYVSIDELWILKKDGKIILDVAKEKFHFGTLLTKSLFGQKLLSFSFDDEGKKAKLFFSDGYVLGVQESERFTRWSVNNFLTGFSVSSYRDDGLNYRISSPIHLGERYKSDDVHLSSILYELDFYRSYFAGSSSR